MLVLKEGQKGFAWTGLVGEKKKKGDQKEVTANVLPRKLLGRGGTWGPINA